MTKVKQPKGKFVKVRCSKCKNEQVIYGKATTKVNCLVCGKPLAVPKGGKSNIKTRIIEVLNE